MSIFPLGRGAGLNCLALFGTGWGLDAVTEAKVGRRGEGGMGSRLAAGGQVWVQAVLDRVFTSSSKARIFLIRFSSVSSPCCFS